MTARSLLAVVVSLPAVALVEVRAAEHRTHQTRGHGLLRTAAVAAPLVGEGRGDASQVRFEARSAVTALH